MPPKQKITKQDILNTAFHIVRESGEDGINARSIAHALNCSTQPVFSYYTNMADLKADVFAMASRYHNEYFNKVKSNEDIFVNVGMAYIDFALEEQNLFRLLFMSDGFAGKAMNTFVTDDCNKHIISCIPKTIYQDSDEATRMFTDMWLYAHGIASLLVNNQLQIDRSEMEAMVKNMFNRITNSKT